MLAFRTLRSLAIVTIMALAVLVPALAAPTATAADDPGTVAIHSRHCEVDAVNLFQDCHGNQGPSGAIYTIDNRVPKPIATSGNVSFGGAWAGDHLVTLTSGFDSGAYSHLRAFCSNSATGTGPNEATILYSDTPQFWVRVAPGSRLTCDVYFVP
jgi:hypothetical protein